MQSSFLQHGSCSADLESLFLSGIWLRRRDCKCYPHQRQVFLWFGRAGPSVPRPFRSTQSHKIGRFFAQLLRPSRLYQPSRQICFLRRNVICVKRSVHTPTQYDLSKHGLCGNILAIQRMQFQTRPLSDVYLNLLIPASAP